jgi:Tfp pilus assembly protein PilV
VSTPRILVSVSVFLLALSAALGFLNTQKTRGLRAQATQSEFARNAAERFRITRENELKGREAAVAAANAMFDETRTKAENTEAELIKAQTEKNNLQVKRRENETEIAQLRKRIEEAEGGPAVSINPSTASTADLRAQLEDAKRQLEAAEREKTLLSDKIRAARERATPPETEKTRRLPGGGNPGIRGTVLAVNRAYNFVVLNLGGRQGVEPNSEMLVLRGGSFIGKIRISSVEPATAIGDIITSSLARGVQVQPGDTVIYAGTNS